MPAEADEARDKGKILSVRTANICRSPVAEVIFNAIVSDASAPYEARSAGVAAREHRVRGPRRAHAAGVAPQHANLFVGSPASPAGQA
jgi:protein-tyrosine-phosphatase